jgi:hypothetical protein
MSRSLITRFPPWLIRVAEAGFVQAASADPMGPGPDGPMIQRPGAVHAVIVVVTHTPKYPLDRPGRRVHHEAFIGPSWAVICYL